MRIHTSISMVLAITLSAGISVQAEPVFNDGSVLPFPPTPMASVTAPRLQDSKMQWPNQQQHLP